MIGQLPQPDRVKRFKQTAIGSNYTDLGIGASLLD
jgi:hypothetical protein